MGVSAELTGALQFQCAQSCGSEQAEKLRGSARGRGPIPHRPQLCWQGLSGDSCSSTWVIIRFVK